MLPGFGSKFPGLNCPTRANIKSMRVSDDLKSMTDDELFALGTASPNDLELDPEETFWQCIQELNTHRATREIFNKAVEFTTSSSRTDRRFGAEVLNNFAFKQGLPYQTESIEPLTKLLYDDGIEVLKAAVSAIGRISPLSVLPRIIELSFNSDAYMRFLCTVALPGFVSERIDDTHEVAIELMRLMQDRDELVRDWATFGLGCQTEADGPNIRNAFAKNLEDVDDVTRYEALRALVRRHDLQAISCLQQLLAVDTVSTQTIELAADTNSPRLLPALEALQGSVGIDTEALAKAINDCDPSTLAERASKIHAFLQATEGSGVPFVVLSEMVSGLTQPMIEVEGNQDQTCHFEGFLQRFGGDVRLAAAAAVSEWCSTSDLPASQTPGI